MRDGGGGVEGAIVAMVEGVADHQPQRPFSSLKESLLMVQRSPPALVFLFYYRSEGRSGGSSAAMTSPTEVVL